MIPRFITCVPCHKEFDVSKNAEGKCKSHSGESPPQNTPYHLLTLQARKYMRNRSSGMAMKKIGSEASTARSMILRIRKASDDLAARMLVILRVASRASM